MHKELQIILGIVHERIMELNKSKYFAGIIIIMLNLGSKVVPIQFSKSTEEYMKITSLTRQLLVFAIAWMGTRDIYAALILTILFTIFSDYVFNEESDYCAVPQTYRVLHNNGGPNALTSTENITEAAVDDAKRVIKQYDDQQKTIKDQEIYVTFFKN